MSRREKLALCVIILLLNLFILFFIAGIGWILCPPTDVFSPGEIQAFSSVDSNSLVQMYGYYYKIGRIAQNHINSGYAARLELVDSTLGQGICFGLMITRRFSNVQSTKPRDKVLLVSYDIVPTLPCCRSPIKHASLVPPSKSSDRESRLFRGA